MSKRSPVTLTKFDLQALNHIPQGEWISWKELALKDVNRPHFRCFRLLHAGLVEIRIPDHDNPYSTAEFRRLPEGCDE